MACCHARIKSLENISKWEYQDNNYVMRGPYDSLLMLKWISQGYFDESTIVQDVKIATKMSLKKALINLKEDAIKHAQSILSCPHYSNELYALDTNTTTGQNIQRIDSASTHDHSARSDFSTISVNIVYRNISTIDNKNNNTSDSDTKIHNEMDIKLNSDATNFSNNDVEPDIANKFIYSEDLGKVLDEPNNENYPQKSIFLSQLHKNESDMPSPSEKLINAISPINKVTKLSEVTLLGLHEAEMHLKRIEKHKIRGYLEKIMCMGSEINIIDNLY